MRRQHAPCLATELFVRGAAASLPPLPSHSRTPGRPPPPEYTPPGRRGGSARSSEAEAAPRGRVDGVLERLPAHGVVGVEPGLRHHHLTPPPRPSVRVCLRHNNASTEPVQHRRRLQPSGRITAAMMAIWVRARLIAHCCAACRRSLAVALRSQQILPTASRTSGTATAVGGAAGGTHTLVGAGVEPRPPPAARWSGGATAPNPNQGGRRRERVKRYGPHRPWIRPVPGCSLLTEFWQGRAGSQTRLLPRGQPALGEPASG